MEKFILELPNAVPIELCNEIIERFKNDDRKENGKVILNNEYVSDEVAKRMKSATEMHINKGTSGWEDVDEKISAYMFEAVNTYLNYLIDTFNFNQEMHPLCSSIPVDGVCMYGFLIQNIKEGDEYKWHVDVGEEEGVFCNVLIYLNTLEDGQGGETEFVGGIKIRPECGKILLFPSLWSFPHRSTKLLKGDKYTCSTCTFRIPKHFKNV
jgi:hypothetical protein